MVAESGNLEKFSELEEIEKELVELAWKAAENAWQAYPVGATILACNQADEKKIFSGGNVENSFFPEIICAEHNAVTTAVQAGYRYISKACVVVKQHPGGSPCGICRQVLVQWSDEKSQLLLIQDKDSNVRRMLVFDLLPWKKLKKKPFGDLNSKQSSLAELAMKAVNKAYVPYSKKRRACVVVGVDSNGKEKEFIGIKLDNASYPASLQAEKLAISQAFMDGFKSIIQLVVFAEDGSVVDGESLQFLREFDDRSNAEILIIDKDQMVIETTLNVVLPDSFGPDAVS